MFLKKDASTETRLTSRCTVRCSAKTSWREMRPAPLSRAGQGETGVSRRAAFAAKILTRACRHKYPGRGSRDVPKAPTSLEAAMTFDETWDDGRRPRLPAAPIVAAVAGALVLAGLT